MGYCLLEPGLQTIHSVYFWEPLIKELGFQSDSVVLADGRSLGSREEAGIHVPTRDSGD